MNGMRLLADFSYWRERNDYSSKPGASRQKAPAAARASGETTRDQWREGPFIYHCRDLLAKAKTRSGAVQASELTNSAGVRQACIPRSKGRDRIWGEETAAYLETHFLPATHEGQGGWIAPSA